MDGGEAVEVYEVTQYNRLETSDTVWALVFSDLIVSVVPSRRLPL